MKKLLALVMAIAMLASLVVIPAVAEEMPTITMIYSGDNNPPDDNDIIVELRNRLGVNLQITYVSSGDYATKINTMMASDTLPDIFMNISGQDLLDLVAAGKILNWEPYLAEYGKNILAKVDVEDMRKAPANKDGLFAAINYGGAYHQTLSVRKDWLQAVGMEVPTTLEEYYDLMVAFTKNDPDGNGQDDTFGMGFMMNANAFKGIFAAYDIPFGSWGQAIQLEDGTVTTVMKHPKFLEAMTYINKLYQEGLIDPDFVNLTNMQMFEQLWNNKVGVLGWEAVGPTNNWYPGRYTFEVDPEPANEFDFIMLNGKGGEKKYPDYNSAKWVINAKCANPELALKVIDYMWYSEEGDELCYLGVEGKHFEWVDKANGKYQRLGIYTDDTVQRAAGCWVYKGLFHPTNCEVRVMNALTQKSLADTSAAAIEWPYIMGVLETRTEYGADLDALVQECFANMVVAKDGLEGMLAEYITRWEDEGGLDYEEEATAAYAAQ